MTDEKQESKEPKEPQELSFGKQMTSLLIVKDMRSKPKEILKGVAFIAFISFFLFSILGRSCQQEALKEQQEQQQIEERISLAPANATTLGG